MICSDKGFPQLKSLLLWACEWTVEASAMPSICRLEISDCNKLVMVPHGLKFFSTLQELEARSGPCKNPLLLALTIMHVLAICSLLSYADHWPEDIVVEAHHTSFLPVPKPLVLCHFGHCVFFCYDPTIHSKPPSKRIPVIQ